MLNLQGIKQEHTSGTGVSKKTVKPLNGMDAAAQQQSSMKTWKK